MVIGIAFTGFVIGGIFALIGSLVMKNTLFGFGGMVGGIGGLVIGYPIGVIGGIIIFRYWIRYNGGIIPGILGSLLGAVIIMVLVVPLKINLPVVWTMTLYLVITPLFGTIGFYLGRKTERKKKHRKR